MPYLNKRQILDLANKKQIYSDKTLVNAQIQPASLDLTLSSKCYRIKASFIPNNIKISEVIKELSLTNIDLNQNKLLDVISEAIKTANARLSSIEKVRSFLLSDEPFSIKNECLTASGLIKRQQINQLYKERLEQLYKRNYSLSTKSETN